MTLQSKLKKRSATILASAAIAVTMVGVATQPIWAGSDIEDANKAIVIEYLDGLFNNGDLAITDALVSQTFVDHGNGTKAARSREDLKNEAVTYRETFPDLDVILTHVLADENLVAYRFESRSDGTNLVPEGKPFFISGLIIDRLENGQIVERWENYDEMGATAYFASLSDDSVSLEEVIPYAENN